MAFLVPTAQLMRMRFRTVICLAVVCAAFLAACNLPRRKSKSAATEKTRWYSDPIPGVSIEIPADLRFQEIDSRRAQWVRDSTPAVPGMRIRIEDYPMPRPILPSAEGNEAPVGGGRLLERFSVGERSEASLIALPFPPEATLATRLVRIRTPCRLIDIEMTAPPQRIEEESPLLDRVTRALKIDEAYGCEDLEPPAPAPPVEAESLPVETAKKPRRAEVQVSSKETKKSQPALPEASSAEASKKPGQEAGESTPPIPSSAETAKKPDRPDRPNGDAGDDDEAAVPDPSSAAAAVVPPRAAPLTVAEKIAEGHAVLDVIQRFIRSLRKSDFATVAALFPAGVELSDAQWKQLPALLQRAGNTNGLRIGPAADPSSGAEREAIARVDLPKGFRPVLAQEIRGSALEAVADKASRVELDLILHLQSGVWTIRHARFRVPGKP